MKSLRRNLACGLLLALCAAMALPAWAQSSFPMVMALNPLAVQIGATTEVEVQSRYNLYGASQVIVTGTGVTVEVIPFDPPKPAAPATEVAAVDKDKEKKSDEKKSDEKKPEEKKSEEKKPEEKKPDEKRADEKDKKPTEAAPARPSTEKIKLRFTVAADALPGVRDFRVITPQGPSTVGQVVLVHDPIVREKGNNDTLKGAQTAQLPATICGAIEKAEDVDFYKFNIDKPTKLTFHVQCMRCQDRIHDLQAHSDPIISLRNSSGTVLAMNDNFFYGDPLLNYEFTTPGEYSLEIRDVRYTGNNYWQYSIEIHDRPFVTNAHPLRVTAGRPTTLSLVGFNLPENATTSISMPADAAEGPQWITVSIAGQQTTPFPVFVSKLPDGLETSEPNSTREQAQTLAVPSGVSGRIESAADLDYFVFEAKKGEKFSFEIIARRLQSSLDPVLRIYSAEGKQLTENDDATAGRIPYFDSAIENWSAPADGKYVLEISDLNLQGGPEFLYFLQATRSEPDFLLEIDSDKGVLSPGMATPLFVRVVRKNGFTGAVKLHVEGLPPGVTATCGEILAPGAEARPSGSLIDGNIIFQAAADAPHGAANIRIFGTAKIQIGEEEKEITRNAQPMQETYFPGGGRGHFPVEMETICVADYLDLRAVKISPTAITLKPGESQKVEIEIERSPGFDKNVTLDAIFRHLSSIFGSCLPPGVTIDEKNSKTLLTGKETKGHLTLTASDKATSIEKHQVPIMAHVALNFAMKLTYCGEPFTITVDAPAVAAPAAPDKKMKK